MKQRQAAMRRKRASSVALAAFVLVVGSAVSVASANVAVDSRHDTVRGATLRLRGGRDVAAHLFRDLAATHAAIDEMHACFTDLAPDEGVVVRAASHHFAKGSYLLANAESAPQAPDGHEAATSTLVEALLDGCQGVDGGAGAAATGRVPAWFVDVGSGGPAAATLASSLGCNVVAFNPDPLGEKALELARCINAPTQPFAVFSTAAAAGFNRTADADAEALRQEESTLRHAAALLRATANATTVSGFGTTDSTAKTTVAAVAATSTETADISDAESDSLPLPSSVPLDSVFVPVNHRRQPTLSPVPPRDPHRRSVFAPRDPRRGRASLPPLPLASPALAAGVRRGVKHGSERVGAVGDVKNVRAVERLVKTAGVGVDFADAHIALLRISPHRCCGEGAALAALQGAQELLRSKRVRCVSVEMPFNNGTAGLLEFFHELSSMGFALFQAGPVSLPGLELADNGAYPLFQTDVAQLQELFGTFLKIKSFDERARYRVYGDGLSLDRDGRYFDYTNLVVACQGSLPTHVPVRGKARLRFRDGVWWPEAQRAS